MLIKRTNASTCVTDDKDKGVIMADVPRISKMLKTFDPRILPITNSLMPAFQAIEDAPSTSQEAPMIMSPNAISCQITIIQLILFEPVYLIPDTRLFNAWHVLASVDIIHSERGSYWCGTYWKILKTDMLLSRALNTSIMLGP